MRDESDRLRAAIRTQEAVVRAMTDALERDELATDALRDQANAESARLVSAMETLSRTSRPPSCAPPARTGEEARRPHVLVVDDDDETRSAIARWLAEEYDVVTACNGLEGVERAQAGRPDAIVADVGMPKMDGLTMVRQIRQMTAPALVPVVFLTGQSAPESVTAGFSAGGIAYLIKPVDLELLVQELRWALAEDPARRI